MSESSDIQVALVELWELGVGNKFPKVHKLLNKEKKNSNFINSQ